MSVGLSYCQANTFTKEKLRNVKYPPFWEKNIFIILKNPGRFTNTKYYTKINILK